MDEHLKYMYSLERFGIKPGLKRMEQMMGELDHPERKFQSIHIAGTNGKGSVAAFLGSVLRKTGLKVGLYTSPHLYTFHERVRVNGQQIHDRSLKELIARIRMLNDMVGVQPTFFEFTTALAFAYFARQQVDIAIVEVGMGGRLDATNVITPILSVITNIGHDHTEFLGKTRRQIAREKAGIIKDGVPVVVGEQDISILGLFEKICEERGAPMYVVVQELTAETEQQTLDCQIVRVSPINKSLPDPRSVSGISLIGQSTFSRGSVDSRRSSPPDLVEGGLSTSIGGGNDSNEIVIPLIGAHQVDNVLAALTALRILSMQGVSISWSDIQKGIAATKWEGRMDVVSKSPLIIVDGAHNADGLHALRVFLDTLPRHDVLVFGLKRGKDISDITKSVVPLFNHLVVTKGAYRPEDPRVIVRKLRDFNGDVQVVSDVDRAVATGRSLLDRDGCMVVTGSLYMIGGALEVLRPRSVSTTAVTKDHLYTLGVNKP